MSPKTANDSKIIHCYKFQTLKREVRARDVFSLFISKVALQTPLHLQISLRQTRPRALNLQTAENVQENVSMIQDIPDAETSAAEETDISSAAEETDTSTTTSKISEDIAVAVVLVVQNNRFHHNAWPTQRWKVIWNYVKSLTLCETRWESKVNSLHAVRYTDTEVKIALEEEYQQSTDPVPSSEAKSLAANFEFFMSLVIWYEGFTNSLIAAKC
ncbi:hypothetical protein TcasGA2_TC005126 [Tribolium castaneum]|uniref:Uncharacterized protein n=1 Tax=Tribolium castaneum TaxID=7070 RepID=D7EIN4_TRICA|nr:hypothetical protein TcasGA2_TC005126 [Tribolium castaneum]